MGAPFTSAPLRCGTVVEIKGRIQVLATVRATLAWESTDTAARVNDYRYGLWRRSDREVNIIVGNYGNIPEDPGTHQMLPLIIQPGAAFE